MIGFMAGRWTLRELNGAKPPQASCSERRRVWLDRLWNLLGLIALGLFAVSWVTSYRINECQAQTNREFALGLAERTEAAAIDREANRIERDAMRAAIQESRPNSTEAQRQQARQRYLAAIDAADRLIREADQKRAASPLITGGARKCE